MRVRGSGADLLDDLTISPYIPLYLPISPSDLLDDLTERLDGHLDLDDLLHLDDLGQGEEGG